MLLELRVRFLGKSMFDGTIADRSVSADLCCGAVDPRTEVFLTEVCVCNEAGGVLKSTLPASIRVVGAEPYKNSIRFPVDEAHIPDLLVLLCQLILIYADCVHPSLTTSFGERICLSAASRFLAIPTNFCPEFPSKCSEGIGVGSPHIYESAVGSVESRVAIKNEPPSGASKEAGFR